MPSINLDLDYFTHPKTRRLIGLLGRGSEVLPIRVWCFCGRHYSETGRLTGISAQEIESEVGWWGQPGEAVAAMIKAGFIEPDDNGYKVHDWLEWSGHLRRYKELGRKRAQARWAKKGGGKSAIPNTSDASCITSCNASCNASPCIVSQEKTENGACPKTHLRPDFPGRGYFPELEPIAARLLKKFQEETRTAHDGRGGAVAIIELLATGQASEFQLDAAIDRWAEYAKKTYQPDKRVSARKFFGGDAPAWCEWVGRTPVAEEKPEDVSEMSKRVAEQNAKRLAKLGLT